MFIRWDLRSEANKARRTIKNHTWHKTNKERSAAQNKAWIEANKERKTASKRAWNQANKERIAASDRAWRMANPDKAKAKLTNQRARRRNAPGQFTADDIARIRQEQGDCCAAPNCQISLNGRGTVDHIIPLSRGGSNWPDNLQLMCGPCNDSKGARTMEEWLAWLSIIENFPQRS